jgi:rod shape-determining protein MreD
MIGTLTTNLGRLIALILVQTLVLDQLDLANGWVVPYLYVLFILLLPFATPDTLTLLLGAVLGLVLDAFTSTAGMHMGACTLMAFARIGVLRLLAPREGYDRTLSPSARHMGWAWFLTYAGILVPLHHLWLFFIEVHRFDAFGNTLLRALLSAAATLSLIVLVSSFSIRQGRSRP